jgi:NAD(P)-dependent dehydrogenase (short-subunit alcohol dehydrogenase family)
VTDEASVARAFAQAGPADILVNNAGTAESAPFERTSAALWQRMLAVNLTGAFHCTQAALPAMRAKKWGRIVNIASTAAHEGAAYVTAYCAAKHGLLGLTRALALEVARDGVTVNAVSPGYTETALLTNSLRKITSTTGRSEAEARKLILRGSGQRRFTKPEEVAAVVVRLCLPRAAGIIGRSLPVGSRRTSRKQ